MAERDLLAGFLDDLRASIAAKADGVPETQARAPGVPSGTNLLGLIKHLTYVERYWLLGDRVADWQTTFDLTADDTAATIIAAYRATNTETNAQIATWDLAEPKRRWTLVHLIEETARHAGHADILRELIDGATGR
ncbi:MAG TPA: DinB family protein [Pseudonocardiaceae bacterium]|nr:DinB family protein [Pseudonocardiaceae bacterium]